MSRILHLHLKFKHFDDIAAGLKPFEYRLVSKWNKKIEGKDYDEVWFYRGFQKAQDGTLIKAKYHKPQIVTITHPEWNNEPQEVYAISTEDRK